MSVLISAYHSEQLLRIGLKKISHNTNIHFYYEMNQTCRVSYLAVCVFDSYTHRYIFSEYYQSKPNLAFKSNSHPV